MMQRVRQVIAALSAKISAEDRQFLNEHLSGAQRKLFDSMCLADQNHALHTAYTALELAAAGAVAVDRVRLIRCCLLHDVGREKGDMSTGDKIAAVLAYRFFPRLAARWSRLGKGTKIKNIRHALYIYARHAERSYGKLLAISETELAEIARRHHAPMSADDAPELRLLREADAKN